MSADPVAPQSYDEAYFLERCGGAEFFRRYGAELPKPQMAYCLRRARLRRGMSVLDVGCGRGEMLHQARLLGCRAVGMDYSRGAVDIARKTGAPVLLADVKALPFPAGVFDRVFFLGVMDHLRAWELEAAFAEFARVLKPGGFVLVHTCSNAWYYKSWSYGLRLRAARLLAGAGFPVKLPSPPRSGEDEALHVNEHSWLALRRFFRKLGWTAQVEPRPNYKLCLEELYGSPLPAGLPLAPMPRLRAGAYLALLWRGPLRWALAREFFCEARPPARG